MFTVWLQAKYIRSKNEVVGGVGLYQGKLNSTAQSKLGV